MRPTRLVWCLTAIFTGATVAQPLRSASISNPDLSPLARQVEDIAKTPLIGPAAHGPAVVRVQILLDRARFSPGQIDGSYGEDMLVAIRGYREAHGLGPGGTVDESVWRLLDQDRRPLLQPYTITAADVKGPFEPIPKDVKEQARLKWMGYQSPDEELGERFHLSPKLLAELNPGKSLTTAGEQIMVPNALRGPARPALRVVISKSRRTVVAYGARNRLLAQYPATIGDSHDPLPIGHWKIVDIAQNPWFNWDPVHFWNADPNQAAEKLPPGPRNPVGVVWMGLSKEHYGIHGTDDPGRIRKDQSYGCIRLTNWDAEDLSQMVRRGTPVIMVE